MSDLAPRRGLSVAQIDALIDKVIAAASLDELVGMMSGKGFFESYRSSGGRWGGEAYRAGGGIERLGVPALYFTDGPRGVARGESTCFPCSMARGASFDAGLERRIGEAIGIEARAQGATLSGAVCINLLRHPAWGRAQETYGEDGHHLGVMGAALGSGIQAHNVVATVKHFALNSIENARFKVDVQIDERTLHEIYLAHFKHVIDAGIATVMSAYNKVNGAYCGQSYALLTDILRDEWGFDGFVHSDWVKGVYDVYGAAAGLDVENPEPLVFGEKLVAAVKSGAVSREVIDRACRRILRVIYRFACAEDPLPDYPIQLVASPAHRGLAREAAEKSAVLLKNDAVLPFNPERIKKLAVLGRLADKANIGDNGSSRVRPPYVITPLAGLRDYLNAGSILSGNENDLPAAREAADAADAVVVIVGYTANDEGEFIPGDINLGVGPDGMPSPQSFSRGGDRLSLDLPADQIALVQTAAESGKPLVVVIVAGSAVMVEGWQDKVGAILQTFYAGMEGGSALARLLFGDVSPSGKLPFTVARDAAHYPHFDRDADAIDYGYWHGYAKFDRDAVQPRFAFGHGLSYARFAYRGLKASQLGNRISVQVAVRNEGSVTADEVVFGFVGAPGVEAERPMRSLKAFTRVTLTPGETRIVDLSMALDDLRWRDPERHEWRLEPGEYKIMVGGNPAALAATTIRL